MTQDQAEAKEISVAQYLCRLEGYDWSEVPEPPRQYYRRHAAEIIATVLASPSHSNSKEQVAV